MDDETLQSVSSRIDRLDNRLKEVENQSHGWIAKIGRVGIIVGCVGGILGGANTFLILWKLATAVPNIELVPAEGLRVYWTPEDRRLSHSLGVTLYNKGEAVGIIKAARAHMESGAVDTEKQLLDDIQVSEKQVTIPFPISVKPADTRELEIRMTSKLTREAEQAFFEKAEKAPYNLVLEVDEVDVPQPKRLGYCIYLGPPVVRVLREQGYDPLESPDPRCTSGDHP